MNLPFKVVFENDKLEQLVANGFAHHLSEQFDVFEGCVGGLDVHIARVAEEYRIRIINKSDEKIRGRIMIVLPWQNPDTGYTLLPGAYYNGNHNEHLHGIPTLKMPEHPTFRIALSGAATPALLFWDGAHTGTHYAFSPYSKAGWNGIVLNGREQTATFSIPAQHDDVSVEYKVCEVQREPYTWKSGETVCAGLSIHKSGIDSIPDLYEYLFSRGRSVPHHGAECHDRYSVRDTVDAVREWVMDKHFFVTEQGRPVLKNAFTNVSDPPSVERLAEWNIMIGWCSGTMTALPLLAHKGRAREIALSYIDFVTTDGFAPSGVKLPIFDGERWIDPRPESGERDGRDYTHLRFYCDYLYYLGRAIEYEGERGIAHPSWERAFLGGADILVDLWRREHDFGRTWNVMDKTVTVKDCGTGAGAFALLALSQALKLYPDREDVKATLLDADAVYFARCVASGRSGGGPNDAEEADDSESIAALSDSYVRQYLLLGDATLLDYALKASRQFASWVYSYQVAFPGGTPLEGVNVCGGVIANVQNRHIGPGICTNSARFLYDLGIASGDRRFIDLYDQIVTTARSCVCMEDGEFFGDSFDEPFLRGMVSEQINVYDVYRESGFTWKVSASWPATNILLSDFDSPYSEKRM